VWRSWIHWNCWFTHVCEDLSKLNKMTRMMMIHLKLNRSWQLIIIIDKNDQEYIQCLNRVIKNIDLWLEIVFFLVDKCHENIVILTKATFTMWTIVCYYCRIFGENLLSWLTTSSNGNKLEIYVMNQVMNQVKNGIFVLICMCLKVFINWYSYTPSSPMLLYLFVVVIWAVFTILR